MTAPALALAGLRKGFGPVLALDGADLVVHPGTLHALLGENGAGKSTLLGIVGGLLRPDAGTMHRDGEGYHARDPRDARAAGIGMVHQHFTTIPALTVWENIALAAGWGIAGAPTVPPLRSTPAGSFSIPMPWWRTSPSGGGSSSSCRRRSPPSPDSSSSTNRPGS